MSDPQGPAIGQEWLNTGDGKKYQWNGAEWVLEKDEYLYRLAWEKAHAASQERAEVAENLVRELVTMIGQALADTERNPLETGFNHSSETTRELARGLILVRNGLFDALAKAKAAGFEP